MQFKTHKSSLKATLKPFCVAQACSKMLDQVKTNLHLTSHIEQIWRKHVVSETMEPKICCLTHYKIKMLFAKKQYCSDLILSCLISLKYTQNNYTCVGLFSGRLARMSHWYVCMNLLFALNSRWFQYLSELHSDGQSS